MRNYKLDRIINESIDYVKTREVVKDIVREELERYAGIYITEKKKKKKKKGKDISKMVDTIKDILNDKVFLKSQVAYDILSDTGWDEDTMRSYFSKMLNGERPWTVKRATRAYQMLHNA